MSSSATDGTLWLTTTESIVLKSGMPFKWPGIQHPKWDVDTRSVMLELQISLWLSCAATGKSKSLTITESKLKSIPEVTSRENQSTSKENRAPSARPAMKSASTGCVQRKTMTRSWLSGNKVQNINLCTSFQNYIWKDLNSIRPDGHRTHITVDEIPSCFLSDWLVL